MMDLATAEVPTVELGETCEPFVVPLARSLRVHPEIEGDEVELDRGSFLFREGQRKTRVYRLEAGIICVTAKRPIGPPNVVEMLFPGSLLGLGFLEEHIESAMAVVPCRLTAFPLASISELCEASEEVRDRQAIQTEREFAARRRALVPDRVDTPVRRVAAFLSAMHHMNRNEGRNPDQIAEFLKTGDVATFLDLDVDALAQALAVLKDRGLVDRASHGGLVLVDPDGLERLAEKT